MDHPGWVKTLPDATLDLPRSAPCRKRDGFTFLGGVPDAHLESRAEIESFGDFAMWDLTTFKRENGRISSRACDDLVGCAAIVTTLLTLQEKNVHTSCVGIFTRAEEVGFVGAIELASTWPLAEDCVFVSIETSVATEHARMGNGPMCRVGDRLSIFDNNATANLIEVAANNEIPIQRALLDRGSCEATALQSYGITTAGISIPLGNYHNCGEHHRIKPEYIDLADLKNLVALLTSIATDRPDGPRDTTRTQREKLEARADRYRAYAQAADASQVSSTKSDEAIIAGQLSRTQR